MRNWGKKCLHIPFKIFPYGCYEIIWWKWEKICSALRDKRIQYPGKKLHETKPGVKINWQKWSGKNPWQVDSHSGFWPHHQSRWEKKGVKAYFAARWEVYAIVFAFWQSILSDLHMIEPNVAFNEHWIEWNHLLQLLHTTPHNRMNVNTNTRHFQRFHV